jgi:DNA mismatch repair protein MutS
VAEQVRAVAAFVALAEQVLGALHRLPGDVVTAELLQAFEGAVQHELHDTLRGVARGEATGDLAVARLDGRVRVAGRSGETAVTTMSGGPTPRMAAKPMETVLRALVQGVWQLDAWCALALASSRLLAQGGCWPTMSDEQVALTVEGVRHPLLPKGVTNDVALAANERVLFLTGPNMAGKSTVLRATGLVVYLAHLGLAVPAAYAVVPCHDRIIVSLQTHDDLARGESLYLAEVRRVGAVVEAVTRGERVFAVLDEAFRGTNVVDASEAMGLLVDGLSCAPHGTFVIASHLADVGASRTSWVGVSCWCMAVTMHADGPVFPYRLERGVSTVHLGMVLLDREGVGPALRALVSGHGA